MIPRWSAKHFFRIDDKMSVRKGREFCDGNEEKNYGDRDFRLSLTLVLSNRGAAGQAQEENR